MQKLNGKIVFITGASSGIGEATARAFAAEGAKLLLAARRVEGFAELTPKLIEQGAAAVHTFALDVRDAAQVATALNALHEEWKTIDILVNNAGLSRGLVKVHDGIRQDWED